MALSTSAPVQTARQRRRQQAAATMPTQGDAELQLADAAELQLADAANAVQDATAALVAATAAVAASSSPRSGGSSSSSSAGGSPRSGRASASRAGRASAPRAAGVTAATAQARATGGRSRSRGRRVLPDGTKYPEFGSLDEANQWIEDNNYGDKLIAVESERAIRGPGKVAQLANIIYLRSATSKRDGGGRVGRTLWNNLVSAYSKKFSGLRPAGKKFGAIATGNVIKRFYDEWIVEQNGGNTGQIGQEASAMKYIDQRLKETGQINKIPTVVIDKALRGGSGAIYEELREAGLLPAKNAAGRRSRANGRAPVNIFNE